MSAPVFFWCLPRWVGGSSQETGASAMGDSQSPVDQAEVFPPYVQSVRFTDPSDAQQVYFEIQSLLYQAEEAELSAYNIQIDGVPHVVALGSPPSPILREQLADVLGFGDAVGLPEPVLNRLRQRREEHSRRGGWVEEHYRPGKRLT